MGAAAGMAAATVASALIGGITAPDGQELKSFDNVDGADPGLVFGETKDMLSGYLNALIGDAGRPVHMQTSVKPLPAFIGGGLPMAIAAPGRDDNQMNPALRDTPGLDIPKVDTVSGRGGRRTIPIPGVTPGQPPDSRSQPHPSIPGTPGQTPRATIAPTSANRQVGYEAKTFDPSTPMTMKDPITATDPEAAVKLLLQSMGM